MSGNLSTEKVGHPHNASVESVIGVKRILTKEQNVPLLNFNNHKPNVTTNKQLKLIDELLIDCSLWDDRKKVILSRFNKSYFDELTIAEASSLIEELIIRKGRPQ
jgi:hypothetical protein